jgi:dTDP-4-dehydrorhamnose 3,5-epimerase
MDVQTFEIEGPCLLTPARYEDSRGYFSETFNAQRFETMTGVSTNFFQDNESRSLLAGTVRGLHYQSPPHAQGKLVRCVAGAILDVAVDVRRGSDTYGQHIRVELSAANGAQLWIPVGFLHGFSTRLDNTVVQYKVTDHYAAACEGSIRFDDPGLGIDWDLTGDTILSEKDKSAPAFSDWASPFTI